MSDPSNTYRDATISASTVDLLRETYKVLIGGEGFEAHAAAVKDVVDRWDANDATEIVLEAARV